MNDDMRVVLVEERLAQHVQHDEERFAALDRRLERIEVDVRALLEWRWKLVGALGAIVFLATVLAGWVK